MDVDGFLRDLRGSPSYRDQIVHVHEVPARQAIYAPQEPPLSPAIRKFLSEEGIQRLYGHQAEAIAAAMAGRDVLITTGPASGKSLCYLVPILEMLLDCGNPQSAIRIPQSPAGTALLLYPAKALCQDQFQGFEAALRACGCGTGQAGVFDGDTPDAARRRLRDHGRVIFSNPDMIHAALMPQHPRWAAFLAGLRYLVLDELHIYNGIFGSNVANLLRRLERLCRHYGSRPRVIASSATIANAAELFERLVGRACTVVGRDGSPRGRRTFIFWNPPRIRGTAWRSRRSANSPWYTIFIYERTPLGLGFTAAAYERLGAILPAVLEGLRRCPCEDGCPCCTGKPLRPYATWDVQRGEASVPSKPKPPPPAAGSAVQPPPPEGIIRQGSDLAARARRLKRQRDAGT